MRLIYPLKALQVATALFCIYNIVFLRQLCIETDKADYETEIKRIVTLLHDEPCQLTFVHKLDFYVVSNSSELNKTETVIDRKKRDTEPIKVLPTDPEFPNVHDKNSVRSLDTTHSYQSHLKDITKAVDVEEKSEEENEVNKKEKAVYREIKNEDVSTEESKEITKESTTSSKMVTEASRKNEISKEALTETKKVNQLSTKVPGKPEKQNIAKLIEKRTTNKMVTCLAIPWTEILLDKVSGIPMSLLSWSVVIFMLMIGVFLLEVAYVSINRKEINKRGAIALGIVHILLTSASCLSLLFFRLTWSTHWSPEYVSRKPAYPSSWLYVEFVAWLLLIFHLLEMVFYRVLRVSIIFMRHYGSYNVAEKEEQAANRTYACDEPHDGSYEL